jgi:hypothetical protein
MTYIFLKTSLILRVIVIIMIIKHVYEGYWNRYANL